MSCSFKAVCVEDKKVAEAEIAALRTETKAKLSKENHPAFRKQASATPTPTDGLVQNGWTETVIAKTVATLNPNTDWQKERQSLLKKFNNACLSQGFKNHKEAKVVASFQAEQFDFGTRNWDRNNLARNQEKARRAQRKAADEGVPYVPVVPKTYAEIDATLLSFEDALGNMPSSGPDRGVFTECVQYAVDTQNPDLRISDVESLIQQLQLQMPPVAPGKNRDAEDFKRWAATH